MTTKRALLIGITLTLALTVGCPMILGIVYPSFLDSQLRSKVIKTMEDMRTTFVALEMVRIDEGECLAHASGAEGVNARFGKGSPAFAVPTLATHKMVSGKKVPYSLTTPIQFIQRLLPDPFAPDEGTMFGYFRSEDKQNAIIFSAGPDRDYDMDPAKDLTSFGFKYPIIPLVNKTYDSTNGTLSNGDLWRVVGE